MMTFIWISLLIVILSMVGMLYRVFRGPSIPDRLIALDGVGVMLISAYRFDVHVVRDKIFH